jgi:hypothetical protein
MEDLNDIVARIPFPITQKVAAAQLSRLSGLTKTIKHITAPRLTYGRVVNNFPAPIIEDPNTGVPFDGQSPVDADVPTATTPHGNASVEPAYKSWQ